MGFFDFCAFFLLFFCCLGIKNVRIDIRKPLCTGYIYPNFENGIPQHPNEGLRAICGVKYIGDNKYEAYSRQSHNSICNGSVDPIFDADGDPQHPNQYINELCKVVYYRDKDIFMIVPR